MKDIWKDDERTKEMPTISREKIIVTDKALIEEFSKLMLDDDTQRKKDYIVPGGDEKFQKHTADLHKIFDQIEADAAKNQEKKAIYYNLEDVKIDDSETLRSALDFLDELKKKNEEKNTESQIEVDSNYKPTFTKSTSKIKDEKPKENMKSKTNTFQLSFSDDLV